MASKKSNITKKTTDYSKPIKLSQMNIAYMMEYIEKNDPGYKSTFKEMALRHVKEDGKSLDIKKIRESFIIKYPNTVIKKETKKKTALEKLKEW